MADWQKINGDIDQVSRFSTYVLDLHFKSVIGAIMCVEHFNTIRENLASQDLPFIYRTVRLGQTVSIIAPDKRSIDSAQSRIQCIIKGADSL